MSADILISVAHIIGIRRGGEKGEGRGMTICGTGAIRTELIIAKCIPTQFSLQIGTRRL